MSRYSDALLGVTGVVSAHPLNEASGTTASDIKGSNTGTYVNSPALNSAGLPSGLDSAVVFTAGSSHHVTLVNAYGSGFSNGPYSFGVWFKMSASGANFAMMDLEAVSGGSGDIGMGLGNLANGRVSVTDGGNRIIVSAATPLYNDGIWHLAIATKIVAGNVWTLFVDGKDVTTADSFPTQATTSGATTNGRIGVQYNAGTQRWFFTGTLAYPFIANVALALTDAQMLYAAGLGGSSPLMSRTLLGLPPLHSRSLGVSPPSGPVVNQTTLTASLSFAGTIQLRTSKVATAGLSFTGALPRSIGKQFGVVLSFTGGMTRQVGKVVTGGLSFGGSLLKRTSHALTAALSFTGSLGTLKAFNVALTATLSFTGSQVRRTGKALTGGLSFTGSLVRRTAHGMTAALSFGGSLAKRTGKALAGGLSFVGSLTTLKAFTKLLTATLSFTGSQTRRVGKALTAGLSFTGSLAKGIRKALAAVLSFMGSLASALTTGGAAIIGGIGPTIAGAVNSVVQAIANTFRPGGGASGPTPGGSASGPKPGR